ncbi:F-box/kelch-repeat protein At3g23880 [Medicago truncatula]|nr:F-box/kelch-repeat protein At3g23880 [Medicago truncatula]
MGKFTQQDFPYGGKHSIGQPYHSIAGSCNGIICLALPMPRGNVIKRSELVLWNPTIRKFKRFLYFETPRDAYGCTLFGFGYDHIIDGYKIIALSFYRCGTNIFKTQARVNTVGTDSWRMINGQLPLSNGRFELLKFVSGALNWISYRDDGNNSVISFDLVNESSRELLQPDYGGESMPDVILSVLRDCLCIFALTRQFSSVWLMKEYGNEESWTKLFHVPYMEEDPFHPFHGKPLWIFEDDKVLMECMSLQNRKMNMAIYDFKSGTLCPNISKAGVWNDPEVCTESLISPKSLISPDF